MLSLYGCENSTSGRNDKGTAMGSFVVTFFKGGLGNMFSSSVLE